MALTRRNLSDVTLASDENLQNNAHTFNYNLNTSKTKKILYKGAQREHYEREDKKVCINLTFSDGAYSAVVLNALEELNNHKSFTVGKEQVERVSLDQRTELSGKHIDTKIEFKVNRGKIVIHAYNTQQKLLIQGSKHKWFVDSYLEPLIKINIANSITKIEEINRDIITTLDTDTQTQENTLDEEEELLCCDKCIYNTKTAGNLRKHIVHEHTTETEHPKTQVDTNPRPLLVMEEHEETIDPLSCKHNTKSSEELTTHIQSAHANQINARALSRYQPVFVEQTSVPQSVFKCEKCSETFDERTPFEKHIELHSYADNLSVAFHQCRVCDNQEEKQEPNIQCSKCIHFFHKKCTNKKDAKGKWKSTPWVCHICSHSFTLNPNAEPFQNIQKESMRPELPPLTGRHRKSNLNQENPETEFLKSQIDTLKSIVSQNDEEIKKLKQSNDLKSKRITQLEAKLEEAQNFVTNQARLNNPVPVPMQSSSKDSEQRINLLEQKYNFLMDQINHLNKPNNQSITFACIKCEFISVTRNDLSNHITETHPRLYSCNKCDFTSSKSTDIKEHKTKTHPPVILKCEKCDFETEHNNQFEKHKKTIHKDPKYPCAKCSYKAIHSNDLRRHQTTMHEPKTQPQHACNSCSYKAIHENDLRRHKGTMHGGIKDSCYRCGYESESLPNLKMHIRTEHRNTRTFYAARGTTRRDISTASSNSSYSRTYAQVLASDIPSSKSHDNSRPDNILLQCHGPCTSIEKTFDHQDKLELHMKFYHASE